MRVRSPPPSSTARWILTRIAAMDDEAAVASIAAVRGLGRWTAEVYLLFALGRHDVFPAGDIALAASAAHLKGLDARPGPAALRDMADAWRPGSVIGGAVALASLAARHRPAGAGRLPGDLRKRLTRVRGTARPRPELSAETE